MPSHNHAERNDPPAVRPPVDLRQLSQTMYDHMRAVGGGLMRKERSDHSLSPTALVGAAVERLLVSDQVRFNDRAHLLAAAAIAMRRVLVEHARARHSTKRGGGRGKVSWDEVVNAVATHEDPSLLLSLDEGIEAVGREEERYGRIVEMKLFGALTNAEIARVLNVSPSTVEKDWKYIKPKLLTILGHDALRR